MTDSVYPKSDPKCNGQRRALAPQHRRGFQTFSDHVFADGALPAGIKQLQGPGIVAPMLAGSPCAHLSVAVSAITRVQDPQGSE